MSVTLHPGHVDELAMVAGNMIMDEAKMAESRLPY